MRRLGPLALSLLLGLFITIDLCAQVGRPPQGGAGTLAAGGGGGGSNAPWMVWSSPPGPYPTTLEQYPLLRFYWCDNESLMPGTRWIKVNGVARTSSFSYTAESPSGDCAARASSQTTSVALNVGENLIEMYICDDDDLGPYCGYSMQYVTRIAEAPVVTPDAEPLSVSPTVGAVQRFAIYNPGGSAHTYSLGTACSGSVSGCSVQGSISISGSQTDYVVVTFNVAGALNAAGTLQLTATDAATGGYDTGSFSVRVAGPVIERGLCLTIAAGANAAYECGDLRVVHPLPSVRTLGKERTPTLVYNSQQAHPFPLLHTDVTIASAEQRPDSIRVTLMVNGTQRDQHSLAGSQWGAAGQTATRRVVAGFNASGDTTGLYSYQLEVGKVVSNNYTAIRTESGTLPIVNRSNSPFGAGWWLAGLEQLKQLPGGAVLWIGGDGSLRRYEQAGTLPDQFGYLQAVYLAAPVDGPDTLLLNPHTARYYRLLKGGGRVVFPTTGFHTVTMDRLGYVTEFAYNEGRLATINIPPTNSGLSYTFNYGGSGILQSVSVPDSAPGTSRVVTIAASGNRIWRITDLSKPFVEFSFDGASPNRIVARTDARGSTTNYAFDAAGRLSQSSLTVPGAHTITRAFCSADARGWAACASSLPDPDSAYTIYDGPRTDSADVVHFWPDAYGAVRRVRDPYGRVTTIARTDARWPALATRVQSPNGRIVSATYDQRGNLASTTDSSRYYPGDNPTTQYTWHQTWDQLAQITLPNGQVTRFGVDPANGNRLWTEDARGASSRMTLEYYTSGTGAGLLSAVILPGGARTSITYSARGNTATVQTPLDWTTYYQDDPLGRTTLVRTPIGSGQYRDDATAYDGYDRAISSVSYALDAGSVTVRKYYDNEDNVYRVERSQWPNPTGLQTLVTQWTFDAANRPTVEVAPDGFADSTWYDPAGNATQAKSRRGHVITMSYDRMNRLRRREVPAVAYPQRAGQGIAQLPLGDDPYGAPHPYPWFPNDGTGLRIDAVTDTFAYNQGGQLIVADNADARVRRTYFKDGSLETDSLSIRNYNGNTFGHVYGLRYTYDVNGRLTALRHPAQLASGTGMRDSVRYVYDGTTGALARVYGLLVADSVRFLYNARDELIRTSLPGTISDSLAYDDLGRLTLDRIRNGSSSPYKATNQFLRSTTFQYADPVRVSLARNADGWKDTVTAAYSGLGHLIHLTHVRPSNPEWTGVADRDASQEVFGFDPMGNARSTTSTTEGSLWGTSEWSNSWTTSYFTAATGRLDWADGNTQDDAFVYDSAGNGVFSYQTAFTTPRVDRASFYGADGRLRSAERRKVSFQTDWYHSPWWVAFEEYRYDALGRRVLVMDRRRCWLAEYYSPGYPQHASCNLSRVRRTVWDGPRELWEIQMPAHSADSALVENDIAPITYWTGSNYNSAYLDPNLLFGRVAYTYAGGVDRPVSITRLNLISRRTTSEGYTYWNPTALAPHWNWRGQADFGTFLDGGVKTCTDDAHCVRVLWRHRAFAVALESEQYARFEDGWYTPYGWFGTLIYDKEDGTGTHYRRNRYVDPTTGRFTQEDPIGLAGGLNLYGFASGDPVNFADPFGLCPEFVKDKNGDCPDQQLVNAAQRSGSGLLFNATAALVATVGTLAEALSSPGAFTPGAAAGPVVARPYVRPSGATTGAQRAAVQGLPCVHCGQRAERMVAGHKRALIEEYYETGQIDVQRMRSVDAVQPECPTCSAREGGVLSHFARRMRRLLGFQ